MTKGVNTKAIAADGAKAASSTDEQTIKDFNEKFEKVELLIADLNRLSEFNDKARDFAEAATKEIAWNRLARVAVLIAVSSLILIFGYTAYQLMVSDNFLTLRTTPTAFAAALASTIGGGTFLLTTATKSVFSSFSSRNEGLPLPEHFKQVMDSTASLIGK